MADTIWDILGISPTSDKRAIKKAYAAKCAACHPEEHPEEFDRLHKAYTAAVKAAARIPADTPTMAPARERTATPADTPTTAPAREQAAIPDISLLVEQGMEQELNASCSKLLESLKKLHDSFPKSVDTNGEDFTKALKNGMNPHVSNWLDGNLISLNSWTSGSVPTGAISTGRRRLLCTGPTGSGSINPPPIPSFPIWIMSIGK